MSNKFEVLILTITVSTAAALSYIAPVAPIPPIPSLEQLQPGMQNAHLTPGVANKAVTQANIKVTICKSGWTATIRPPSTFTTALKKKQIGQYEYADTDLSHYEEDHLISLQLGGAPDDPQNLWPEPYAGDYGARKKDVVETALKRRVCAGEIQLAEAQRIISTDWIAEYVRIKSAVPAQESDTDD